MSSEFSVAKGRIEKEKNHKKLLFYDKLTMADNLLETPDCESLFVRLKSTDKSLGIYKIQDSEIKK